MDYYRMSASAEGPSWPEVLVSARRRSGESQSYIVIVADPSTGEIDAHGPSEGIEALCLADEMRRDLDMMGLYDIKVRVVRLRMEPPAEPSTGADAGALSA
jgi:hypothetical protein